MEQRNKRKQTWLENMILQKIIMLGNALNVPRAHKRETALLHN